MSTIVTVKYPDSCILRTRYNAYTAGLKQIQEVTPSEKQPGDLEKLREAYKMGYCKALRFSCGELSPLAQQGLDATAKVAFPDIVETAPVLVNPYPRATGDKAVGYRMMNGVLHSADYDATTFTRTGSWFPRQFLKVMQHYCQENAFTAVRQLLDLHDGKL